MRIGFIADPHLIAPDDTKERRTVRTNFANAWPNFRQVVKLLNENNVDQVIIIGDLIDYYSARNLEFALNLLEELSVPWHLTPGNHDFQFWEDGSATEYWRDRDGGYARFQEADVTLENRYLDFDGVRFLLVDSSLSDVQSGTREWIRDRTETHKKCILCTHVPLDVQPVTSKILDIEPDRNLDKYVQRGAPNLFDDCIQGRIDRIFSGHLHFSATIEFESTTQIILPQSVRPVDPSYSTDGTVYIYDTEEFPAHNAFTVDTLDR